MNLTICEKADAAAFESENWSFPEAINNITRYLPLRDNLFKICESLETEGKPVLAQNVCLVAHTCGMVLKLGEPGTAFKPLAEWQNGRTVSPDDLTNTHLSVLRSAKGRTENAAIKARLSDLLWLKARPPQVADAESAIQSYLTLAKQIRETDVDHLLYSSHYLKRAIQLLKKIGGNEEIRAQIQIEIEACLFLSKPEPNNFIRFFFYNLISEVLKPEDLKKWIDLGEDLISKTMTQKNFEKARAYREAMSEILKLVKDADGSASMLEKRTDLFVQEAREMRSAKADPSILQSLYNKAIEACRNTKGKSTLAKELHGELLEIQKAIPSGLKMYSQQIDLQPAIEEKIKLVREKTFLEAVKIVAIQSVPRKKETTFKEAEEVMKNFPLQSLVETVFLDEKGKIIARRTGMGTTPDEQAAAIRARAVQDLLMAVEIRGVVIGWVQRELNNRTDFEDAIFDNLLYPNPFVPTTRIQQFKRGLICGLKGDWISSTSILVPLLENSLRAIMQIAGHNMTTLDADGVQKERDLNSFIYSEELAALIGMDMQFQLQVLLCDKTGLNLRNQIAHGLMTDGAMFSGASPFIWSLSLLMLFTFQERYYSAKAAPNSSGEDSERT